MVDPACLISRPFVSNFAEKSTTCRMFAARLSPAMASIARTIKVNKVLQAHQAEARGMNVLVMRLCKCTAYMLPHDQSCIFQSPACDSATVLQVHALMSEVKQ